MSKKPKFRYTKSELYEMLKKIHAQSKKLTEKMWDVLEPWIEKEIDALIKINPRKYKSYTDFDWENYIRYKMSPEWCALIDKNYNLRAQRYGFAEETVFFSKPLRCVAPKPYSIGEVHYHPRHKMKPSARDLAAWVNRYLLGERVFCIHTDFMTICYIFAENMEKDIPKELKSFALSLFGYPRSIRKKLHQWFDDMIAKGKIEVLRESELLKTKFI